LEKSYLCSEQVSQMQAQYDAFTLVKIAHDAGVDLVNNPIDFYCYDFGGQISVFWDCMKGIFGEVEELSNGYDEHGMTLRSYRVPLPELKQFYPLLKDEERSRYIHKFNGMLRSCDDYFCEFEMKGMLAGNCIHISLTGEYGLYSPLLRQLVAIRNEVRALIRARREQLINGLRSIVLAKKVYDRLGIVIDASLGDHVNVMFSRVIEQCGSLSIALDSGDTFSFESMIKMLDMTLDQVAINNKREGVAA
jgi:hypothetical protein